MTFQSAMADTIEVRADNWCPYNCGAKDVNPGYMIEALKQIFESKGHKINYEELNWARSLQDVRDGKITAVVGAAEEDKDGMVLPKTPFGNSKNCFYGKPGLTWKYEGAASLDKIKVGLVKDYTYGEPFDSYFAKNALKNVNVYPGDDAMEANANLAHLGRIDVLIEDHNVVGFFNKTASKKLQEYGCQNEDGALFVGFSAKNPKAKEFAKIFDEGIAEMKKSGKLKTLLDKYGVPAWF